MDCHACRVKDFGGARKTCSDADHEENYCSRCSHMRSDYCSQGHALEVAASNGRGELMRCEVCATRGVYSARSTWIGCAACQRVYVCAQCVAAYRSEICRRCAMPLVAVDDASFAQPQQSRAAASAPPLERDNKLSFRNAAHVVGAFAPAAAASRRRRRRRRARNALSQSMLKVYADGDDDDDDAAEEANDAAALRASLEMTVARDAGNCGELSHKSAQVLPTLLFFALLGAGGVIAAATQLALVLIPFFFVAYVVYWVLICMTPTMSLLTNRRTRQEVTTHVAKLRAAVPTISFHGRSYHKEHYTTRDSNGHTHHRTRDVTTHCATERFELDECRDESTVPDAAALATWPVARVRIQRRVYFSDHASRRVYEAALSSFNVRNRSFDTYYSYSELVSFGGDDDDFSKRWMYISDGGGCGAHPATLALLCLIGLHAVAFHMLFSESVPTLTYTIRKLVHARMTPKEAAVRQVEAHAVESAVVAEMARANRVVTVVSVIFFIVFALVAGVIIVGFIITVSQ